MTKEEREEAIAIIRKEYLCVDRDCDIERNCGKCDLMMPSKEPILKAYKMAIQALSQEPCEDSISREDALLALTGEIKETDTIETIIARIARRIRKLPPVNPTKTGHWIQTNEFFINKDGQFIYKFICSECKSLSYFRKSNKKAIGANVCPNCGAKMVDPQERSDKE